MRKTRRVFHDGKSVAYLEVGNYHLDRTVGIESTGKIGVNYPDLTFQILDNMMELSPEQIMMHFEGLATYFIDKSDHYGLDPKDIEDVFERAFRIYYGIPAKE